MSTMEVPHLKIHVDENLFLDSAKEILSVFRQNWDTSATQYKVFTDGITNKLIGCFNELYPNDVVLIRIYGNRTDMLIDRKAESKNIKILHLAGLAPKLYGTFDNGLVYEYIPGGVLTTVSCQLENVYELVAKKLAEMHCVTADGLVKKPALWKTLKKFLSLIPKKFSLEETEKKFNELFSTKINLENEYSFLEQQLSALNSDIVFCHNDLLLGNIIHSVECNSVTFIDYEYAAYNYQAYDIANHFNEYAGVENVDYSLFPNETFQKKWLKIYLKHFKRKSNNCEEVRVSEEDVEQLYLVVQKFTLASHFLWGVWGFIQAEYSTIDFNFIHYSFLRFQEYYKRKKQIFCL